MAISESQVSTSQSQPKTSSTVVDNNDSSSSKSGSSNKKMEYAWLEPKHDPIATDTNLAEIDFEDFRNEDLAYAFSCGVSCKVIE